AGRLLDVALGSGGGLAVDELLGRATTEHAGDPTVEVLLRVAVALDVRRLERHAERVAARDDRDLADRVGTRREHPDQRVAGLVHRGPPPVLGLLDDAARGAEDDPLERI